MNTVLTRSSRTGRIVPFTIALVLVAAVFAAIAATSRFALVPTALQPAEAETVTLVATAANSYISDLDRLRSSAIGATTGANSYVSQLDRLRALSAPSVIDATANTQANAFVTELDRLRTGSASSGSAGGQAHDYITRLDSLRSLRPVAPISSAEDFSTHLDRLRTLR